MSIWQKLGIVAFILLTMALLAWAVLLVFFAQLHPYDCSEIGAACYEARVRHLGPRVLIALLLWGSAAWLVFRDWGKN